MSEVTLNLRRAMSFLDKAQAALDAQGRTQETAPVGHAISNAKAFAEHAIYQANRVIK